MFRAIKETLFRWRTWIVNGFFAIVLILPELIISLMGFDWATIVPAEYMPWVTLFILIVNVWMRPRAAVLAHDPEVQIAKEAKEIRYETGE